MDALQRTEYRQEPPRSCRSIHAWLKLAAGLAVILILMAWLGPMGLKLPGMAQMARLVEEQDIRANAIYYTDLEEFARANAAVKDSLAYPPSKRPQQTAAAFSGGKFSPPQNGRSPNL